MFKDLLCLAAGCCRLGKGVRLYLPVLREGPARRSGAVSSGTQRKMNVQERYVVSLYVTVWNDDRYYLVGWSDKRNAVNVFRIDRMEVPKQLPNKRISLPETFDVRDYTDKVFRMYGGPKEAEKEILNQVTDRFGDGIELKDGKDTFSVTVR